MYEGCTRNAYHLYMFRYDASRFSGLPRAAFLKALGAEGVPALGRLLAAQQGAVSRGRALGSGLQSDLLEGAARHLARAEPLSAERSPLHGGGLARADDAARAAAGHGRHRGSGAEGAGARAAADEGIRKRGVKRRARYGRSSFSLVRNSDAGNPRSFTRFASGL